LHILVNDFIGGVLDRGIPLYVRNLVDGLREEGFRVSVVRAPALCRALPRNVFYMLAVLVEQTALPLIGFLLRANLTLYPYNSVAVVDLFTGRGRIVIHDLEQLNRRLSFSKLYYLACYRVLKRRNAPIFAISELTRQRLLVSGLFGRGTITLLPNTFYAFEQLLAQEPRQRDDRRSIILCTGSTANKDVEALVADYLPQVLAAGFRVTVVGLHKAADAPRLASLQDFIAAGQLRLCERLSDREVARLYRAHSIAWVHSLREGFGRCVVEGRLAGCRVICSDIAEFAALRDSEVYLYRNSGDFMRLLEQIAPMPLPTIAYGGYPYRALLRAAVESGFAGANSALSGGSRRVTPA
jgi:glycosyltransferase involved in cell wall biosynthesis